LLAAMGSAALDQPLMVVLDDLHWADTGTAFAATSLPSRSADLPILWVLAVRSGDGSPALRAGLERLVREGARQMPVHPLAAPAVAAVLADRLEARPDAGLLQLAAGAGGNPGLLVELLRGLREEDRLRMADGRAVALGDRPPSRLTSVLQERLDRLSEDARQLVRIAAVLAHRFAVEQVAAVLGCRPSALADALDEALRADLLVPAGDALRFRHEILRETVVETLPRSLGRALQREVARVLQAPTTILTRGPGDVRARAIPGLRPLTCARRPGWPAQALDPAGVTYAGPRRCPPGGRPDAGWESLTPAELRVVRLVAGGATNREAAEELYLSQHTVSSHLRSAFAKLGVHTRTQLARVVLQADGLTSHRS
jgi:DNA-binding CsgD family transcriptional regulator